MSHILKSVQLLFLLFLISFSYSLASEYKNASLNIDSCDNIILRNGEEIRSKVIEVGVTEIKYRRCPQTSSPIYSVLKSDVFMIQYANGNKDIMPEEKVVQKKSEQETINALPQITEDEKLIARILEKKQFSEIKYNGIDEVKIGDVISTYSSRGRKWYGIVSSKKFNNKGEPTNKIIFKVYQSIGKYDEWESNIRFVEHIIY